jgi:hypothetical protein
MEDNGYVEADCRTPQRVEVIRIYPPTSRRIGTNDSPNCALLLDGPSELDCRQFWVLLRQYSHSCEPMRCFVAPRTQQAILGPTHRSRDLAVLVQPEVQAKAGKDDRQIDAFRVEHSHPFGRVGRGQTDTLLLEPHTISRYKVEDRLPNPALKREQAG